MLDHTKRQHPIKPDTTVNTDVTPDGRHDTVVPLHRPGQQAGISIERIETEQMTPDEYNRSITLFATLINQWKSHTGNQSPDDEIAA